MNIIDRAIDSLIPIQRRRNRVLALQGKLAELRAQYAVALDEGGDDAAATKIGKRIADTEAELREAEQQVRVTDALAERTRQVAAEKARCEKLAALNAAHRRYLEAACAFEAKVAGLSDEWLAVEDLAEAVLVASAAAGAEQPATGLASPGSVFAYTFNRFVARVKRPDRAALRLPAGTSRDHGPLGARLAASLAAVGAEAERLSARLGEPDRAARGTH